MKSVIELTIWFIKYVFYLSLLMTVTAFSIYLYGQILIILRTQGIDEYSYYIASFCMAFAIIGVVVKMIMWYINKSNIGEFITKIRNKIHGKDNS